MTPEADCIFAQALIHSEFLNYGIPVRRTIQEFVAYNIVEKMTETCFMFY